MNDYLEVEYSNEKRPFTQYPQQLAKYLFLKYDLQAGESILEVGCGRCEVLQGFSELGLKTFGIDGAASAAEYALNSGAKFEQVEFVPNQTKQIFDGKHFDIIFSKSFIEHISDPVAYFDWCKNLLADGGKIITLTPDWESNYKIFFDDFTHVKPFTVFSLSQVLETSNLTKIKVEKFRQLPITWNNRFINFLSALTAVVSHHRSKNKWFRWSRELMITSIATKNIS